MSFQCLLYHGLYRDLSEIRGKPRREYLSVEDFKAQVRWMIETGHALLSLARCRKLCDEGSLPPRAVCVTFDDGKRSDLTLAAPVLVREGCEATFFIVRGWIGHPESMALDQVKELSRIPGMEVGSHSLTHPFLSEMEVEGLVRETSGSRKFLEDLLGLSVESFSYPFGDASPAVVTAVKQAGYRIGCSTLRGRNSHLPDWMMLRRWGVPENAGVEGLSRILSREAPSWGQSAGEVVKRAVGMRRFVAWKDRWVRRGAE